MIPVTYGKNVFIAVDATVFPVLVLWCQIPIRPFGLSCSAGIPRFTKKMGFESGRMPYGF